MSGQLTIYDFQYEDGISALECTNNIIQNAMLLIDEEQKTHHHLHNKY